jgi:transcriptional regulator with XRE-family HTH domain
MTQRQLAEKTGMLPSAISRILHAQTNLTLKTIAVLEQALGSELIGVA